MGSLRRPHWLATALLAVALACAALGPSLALASGATSVVPCHCDGDCPVSDDACNLAACLGAPAATAVAETPPMPAFDAGPVAAVARFALPPPDAALDRTLRPPIA